MNRIFNTLPVALALLGAAARAEPPAPPPPADAQQVVLHGATMLADLDGQAGQAANRADMISFVGQRADLEASVGNGTFNGVSTGVNLMAGGALSGLNGIGTVVQNSGNQVVIQNSTILNVSLF